MRIVTRECLLYRTLDPGCACVDHFSSIHFYCNGNPKPKILPLVLSMNSFDFNHVLFLFLWKLVKYYYSRDTCNKGLVLFKKGRCLPSLGRL